MVELQEQIKVSNQTKGRLLDIQEKGQHSSMDSAVRSVLDENEKLKIENELLKKKLEAVTEEKNGYQFDLNLKILEFEKLKKSIDAID